MAEFCNQCARDIDPEMPGDFKGMEPFSVVLCEGCGAIQVDGEGNCISNDCFEKHGTETIAGLERSVDER